MQFCEPLYFTRHNHDRNEHRFYALSVERDLFGEWVLLKVWGRIRQTRFMQSVPFVSLEEANTALETAVKKRVTRGYSLKK